MCSGHRHTRLAEVTVVTHPAASVTIATHLVDSVSVTLQCRIANKVTLIDLFVQTQDIYPLGTCEAHGGLLQPPLGYTRTVSTWPIFLHRTLQSARHPETDAFLPVGGAVGCRTKLRICHLFVTCAKWGRTGFHTQAMLLARVCLIEKLRNVNMFPQEPGSPARNLFKVGMKLEAVDVKNPQLICPATVGEVDRDQVWSRVSRINSHDPPPDAVCRWYFRNNGTYVFVGEGYFP